MATTLPGLKMSENEMRQKVNLRLIKKKKMHCEAVSISKIGLLLAVKGITY